MLPTKDIWSFQKLGHWRYVKYMKSLLCSYGTTDVNQTNFFGKYVNV